MPKPKFYYVFQQNETALCVLTISEKLNTSLDRLNNFSVLHYIAFSTIKPFRIEHDKEEKILQKEYQLFC